MRTNVSFLLLCGAFLATNEVEARVNVVATVPDLAALTREVGGDQVRVTTLSQSTQDPRLVDATPAGVVTLSRADLLVAVGLDLERGWLPALQTAAHNPRIDAGGRAYLECASFVKVLTLPAGETNPYYLFDPRQAGPCARAIAGKLAELDPDHATVYETNGRKFVAQLDAAIADWETRVSGLRGRPVVVHHRSWNYLVDWLGLERVGDLDPPVAEVASYPGGTDVASGETYIEHIGHVIDAVVAACG